MLDVVLRALVVRGLGPTETAVRLQGLIGGLGAALFLFLVIRAQIGALPAAIGVVAMTAVPLFADVAHLSMHHPMTLFFGMTSWWLYERISTTSSSPTIPDARPDSRAKNATAASITLLFVTLAIGMQFDWPGYFMPALLWLDDLVRHRRRIILVGLPLLVLSQLVIFFVHLNWIVDAGPGVIDAMRNAAAEDVAMSWRDGLLKVWEFQRDGFGPIALGVVGITATAMLFDSPRRRAGRPWLIALAYGTLHFVAFPQKAPLHDFWGAYLLPLAGVSFAVVAELVRRRLPAGPRATFVVVAFAVITVALTATLAHRHPVNDAAVRSGERHRKTAQLVLSVIPEEDRGLLLTNARDLDGNVMMAYLRINTLFVDPTAIDPIRLRDLVRRQAFHVRGRKVIFWIVDGPTLAHKAEAKRLREQLAAIGSPYRGLDFVFDVTTFFWE